MKKTGSGHCGMVKMFDFGLQRAGRIHWEIDGAGVDGSAGGCNDELLHGLWGSMRLFKPSRLRHIKQNEICFQVVCDLFANVGREAILL